MIRENLSRIKSARAVIFAALFAAVLFISFNYAKAEGEPVKIYTADDLLRLADNPEADYILMDDIDMKDIEWKPVDYSGNFDGNNHAILNLNVTSVSEGIRTTYDGNYKTYDTHFACLFGVIENASVKNK